MKFSIRTIPAAAAMTAALIFGAQAQAQTTTTPSTAEGGKSAMPAGPNTTGKTMQQRDMGKPMAGQGSMGGSMGAGGTEQPVRQADKVAKNKAERMEKGSKQKSSMNKSNAPVRESDIKDMPAK